ncbi:heavy-metal-associated domain-containing protein [Flaviflexus huanghaiensis]|uniref:heavy-metal-associated domain-containing protein n=1 Tax=Flaviflexus huanghaiensis TaxID=1111473 RepID=UPI0015FA51E8|nr:heavy-metal-associated domain-containing protein [Flaviflexus huanghaiensis]
MTTTEYKVTGMTCGHCERHVTEEVTQVDGVESVDVSHETGRLIVTSSKDITDADIIAAVDEAGYEAVRA